MKIALAAVILVSLIAVLAVRQARAEQFLALNEGAPAPPFSLPDQDGKMVSLSDFSGKSWVVLYFYPKDDTPGCTKEACDFRDNFEQIGRLDAAVLGISVDSVASHKRFAEKFRLNFPLLADEGKSVVRAYGVLGNIVGFRFARRSTFLIDPSGRIRKIFSSVTPTGHSSEVAAALAALKFTK